MRADREDEPAVLAAVAQRLQRDGGADRVEAPASVFLGNRKPLQLHLPALLPQVARKFLLAVAVARTLIQLQANRAISSRSSFCSGVRSRFTRILCQVW